MKIFLSYSSADDAAARALKAALEKHDSKLDIFFAPEKFRAGQFWLPGLADEIAKSKACVVLIGEKGPGRWQLIEYYAAYDRSVKDRSYKTVPVVLAKSAPGFPFIEQLHWIAAEAAGDRAAALVLDAIKGKTKDKPAPWKIVNPFRDLEAFDEAQADLYFGRDEEVDGTVKALAGNAKDVTILIGNSGVGKSSLVKAGIFAALRRRKFARAKDDWPLALEGSRRWLYLTFKPGEAPLDALASAFMNQWALDPTSATDKLKRSEWVTALTAGKLGVKDLVDATFARLKDLDHPAPEAVFLYVDQGEELYGNPPEAVRRFSEALTRDLDGKRLRVLMSMRSDHYHKLQADAPLFSRSARIDVPPLETEDFEEIMTKAAAALGAKFAANDLPHRIAISAADQPGALALLSVYLADMWRAMQDRGDGTLALAQAEDTIDIGTALERRASRYYNDAPARQAAIQHLFVPRLVRVPKDGPPLRRRVRLKELEDDAQRKIVNDLARHDMRLLVTSLDQDKEPTAEVAHEVLFRAWPLLNGWIAGQRGFLEWKDEVEQDRKTWEDKGRRRRDVLMGGALERAKEKLRDFKSDLDQADKDFIETSIGWARQKAIAFVAALSVAFLLLGGGLYYTNHLRAAAEGEKANAETALREARRRESLFLAEMSRNALKDRDIDKALAIALEAMPDEKRGKTQPVVDNALSALSESYWRANWTRTLRGHASAVTVAQFSPDGSRALTASTDGTARLWRPIGSNQFTVLAGHEGAIRFAAFSPDGSRIATASADGTARLWDGETGQSVAILRGHESDVGFVAFSPNGKRIVTASSDKTARLWDGVSGAFVALLQGHSAGVRYAAFAPDGSRLATTSDDLSARLWDAVSGRPIGTLEDRRGRAASRISIVRRHMANEQGLGRLFAPAVFSQDGKTVVTAIWDKTAQIWDVGAGTSLGFLEGHGDTISSIGFSPSGDRLVTSSWDGTARLWDSRTWTSSAVLEGHDGAVTSAKFSRDGQLVLSASEDGTARVWDSITGSLLGTLEGHGGPVRSADISPDGGHILTASSDLTARLWKGKIGQAVIALAGHRDAVRSASFSPDGRRALTASPDRTARIWDSSIGTSLVSLIGHDGYVFSAEFSPDGTRVVTASADKTARLWDGRDGKPISILQGHSERVDAAVFSGDGERIATLSERGIARLSNGVTGAFIATLEGHREPVTDVAFSRDGRRVVTASADATARLWDARTGTFILTLNGHEGAVRAASFSPDGKRVVTASDDNTARLWDAESGSTNATFESVEDTIDYAVFSPDGSQVAGKWYKSAWLWDSRSGALIATLEGHGDAINSLEYSRDGTRIVTASGDGTARIWDSKTGAAIAVLVGHTGDVRAAEFSPDGTRVITAGGNTARIWPVPFASVWEFVRAARSKQSRCLESEERKALFLGPIAGDLPPPTDVISVPVYCFE